MNNQEAIKILEGLAVPIHAEAAFDMAISALQAQEEKTQLSREDTTSGVQKTCITCKHYPPESKWPCIDCDMRNPADRWEPQELSKNSPKLDKENGDLHPTCNELAKDTNVPCKDTISRQAAIDAVIDLCKHYTPTKSVNHPHMDFVIETLQDLPPAQPEPLVKESRNLVNDLVKDTISRQAAIDIVTGYSEQLNGYIGTPNDTDVYAYARGLILGIERNLNALQSAQPEIIMCKDCKYYIKSESYCSYCDCSGLTISDLDFCSLAERRDDGED